MKILTAREAAELLGVSVATIGRLCVSGELPGAYKTGSYKNSHWKIPQTAIEHFLNKSKKQTGQPKN